mgnify:CR=1 FL=1
MHAGYPLALHQANDMPPDLTCSIYIGLGSNMGNSTARLAAARDGISAMPGTFVSAASSLYLTEPQGDADQPFFLNQVLRAERRALAGTAQEITQNVCSSESEEDALSFMKSLQRLETDLGRIRVTGRRFGPRAIDLDLLLFGNTRMNTEQLTLPHPRMLERAFVLLPLAEIAPDLRLPSGSTVKEALCEVNFKLEGNRIFQSR